MGVCLGANILSVVKLVDKEDGHAPLQLLLHKDLGSFLGNLVYPLDDLPFAVIRKVTGENLLTAGLTASLVNDKVINLASELKVFFSFLLALLFEVWLLGG
jgi:hypothetical protein